MSLHIHDREITVWYDHSKTFFLCNEYWFIEAIFLKGVHSKLFSICKLLYNVSLSNNQATNTIKSEKKYYFWGAHLLEEKKDGIVVRWHLLPRMWMALLKVCWCFASNVNTQ